MPHTSGDGLRGSADNVPRHPPTEVAHPPTEVAALHPATEVVSPESPAGAARPAGIVRYGPGVPAGPGTPPGAAGRSGRTAEEAWRGGGPAAPPGRAARLRRAGEPILTVLLLAASAVVFILRFAHPGGLQVTGAAIAAQAGAGCEVTLTGRIATNGKAGTVSYQWQIGAGGREPRPLSQSVTAGQHAADVTAELAGAGFGSAARTVTLHVLSPGSASAATQADISC
jgi:hypothetical protein